MRLLIAYDGSETSIAAIEDLSRAGLANDVEARVLCVADVYPHFPPEFYQPDAGNRAHSPAMTKARELAASALREAQDDASAGANKVLAQFPQWKIDSQSCGDVPYHAIVKHAEEWRADLIVMGSQGRGAVGRAVLGSVAQKVLTHALCSVRIGRLTRTSQTDSPRILIGIDNSVGAATAVDAVAHRTWPAGSEAIVAMALDLRTSGALAILLDAPDFDAAVAAEKRHWVDAPIEQVTRELQDAGLKVSSVVKQADPKRFLIEQVDARGVDCIFLGARGLSQMERFLIGSVSSGVAARAHCSVEVVRAGA